MLIHLSEAMLLVSIYNYLILLMYGEPKGRPSLLYVTQITGAGEINT